MSKRLVITQSKASYLFDLDENTVIRKDGGPVDFDGEVLNVLGWGDPGEPVVGQPMTMLLAPVDGRSFIRRTSPVVAIHGLQK